jgi:hypothetical protein
MTRFIPPTLVRAAHTIFLMATAVILALWGV